MADTDTRSTKALFKAWRQGDADAGQTMAQRFADWYYAVATSRLGEARGAEPCSRSCAEFGQGIVNVTESRALVKWAHDIIKREVASAGDRAKDGDEASAYTGNQKPKGLLRKAKDALPKEVELMVACYSGASAGEELEALAAPYGGMPLGVLRARYTLKQWLRDHCAVPFEVAPDNPILDRAPLPLYEADRMENANEESDFEQWMLTDIDLCKDIAEFAQFSIALRGGLKDAPVAPTADTPQGRQKAPTPNAPTDGGEEASAGGGPPMGLIIGGVIGLVVIVGGGIAAAMFAM